MSMSGTADPDSLDEALQALLVRHEGLRLKPYRDTEGELTIGVGRNLDAVGVSREEAFRLLEADIARVRQGLNVEHPWWRSLNTVRQRALIDMTFNLGLRGLDGFAQFLLDLQAGDFLGASEEMLRSRWARQVGSRAVELSAMIRSGADT